MTETQSFQTPTIGGPPPVATATAEGPRGYPVIAWLIILAVVTAIVVRNQLPVEAEAEPTDPVGLMLMETQSKYFYFALRELERSGAADQAEFLYTQSKLFNMGLVPQRQRYAILAAQLAGHEDAIEHLDQLATDLQEHSDRVELTEEQARVNELLRRIYAAEPGAAGISDDDEAFLVDHLDWFGELATCPAGADDPCRDELAEPGRHLFFILATALVAIGGAGFLGFVGLMILLVLAVQRRVRGLRQVHTHHGIYAETFAVWLVIFVAVQFVLDQVTVPAGLSMVVMLTTSFGSLVALAWPCLRGVPWRQVRGDIGLKFGRPLEPFWGLAGYAGALPLLGIGVCLVLVLAWLQQAAAGAADPLTPAGGAAHPVIEHLGSGGWSARLQILVLGTIIAPLLEETMFRGVLYRHLRSLSARWSTAGSVAFAIVVNALVFAVIHPQNWIAVPALMSLAVAFSLAREWRGSLVAPMIMHGLSNGIVMTLVILCFSV